MTTVRIVGPEVRVNTTTASNQYNPYVAALIDGGYVVTWMSSGQDGSAGGVYAQRYSALGVAVGGEFRVNTTTANDQVNPTVSGLADGGYAVAWMSSGQDGSGWGVYSQRYDSAGAVVGGEVRVNTTTTSDQTHPSITGLADGGYAVVWISLNQDGSGWGVYGQRYDATGALVGAEVRINTTTLGDQSLPVRRRAERRRVHRDVAVGRSGWLGVWDLCAAI